MEGETPMALINLGCQTLLPAGSAQTAPRTILVCYLSLFLSSSGCSGTASIQGAGWCQCRIQPRDSWGGAGKAPWGAAFPLSCHTALSEHPGLNPILSCPKTECVERKSHSPILAHEHCAEWV